MGRLDPCVCVWLVPLICVCVAAFMCVLSLRLLTGETDRCPLLTPHRGVHPVLRRQHVHEGGDPHGHTHGGRGRLAPLHVPAGLRPADGRHLPRVCRHAEAGAGQWTGQADGQPRYRMSRP